MQSFQEVLSIEPFTAQEGQSIALFDSPAWKEMLFGQVRLNGSSFTFIPGRLQPPSLPPSLILENAPFNDHEFIEFWRQAFITGKISIHGKEYIVPKDFKLIQKSGYAFSQAVFSNIVQEPEHVLNSQNLRLFLGGQVIQNGQIIYQQGLIEQSSNKTLSILVSDELSHGQWSQILEACRRYDTTIKVQALPNIFIPEPLQNHISRYDKRSEMQIIETNDVEQYLHQNPSEGLIIDVSDFDASDLFEFLNVKKDASGQFIFESTPSWLSRFYLIGNALQ